MGGVSESSDPNIPDEWLAAPDQSVVKLESGGYPELLSQIDSAPHLLYVKGDAQVLDMPAIAIVGSRNPTSTGRRNAFEFARYLASSGFLIVSGLAEGIDAAAHRGALEAGMPTVAVLGTGVDVVYPAKNHELAHAIAANGALLSEYALGTGPRRWHFPERNRVISGLALGTLVVEAARQSGSLITARLAAEQGREVFALPGSIHNPLARGCHRLIRDGAKLVESADDIFAELAPLAGHVLETSAGAAGEPAASGVIGPDTGDDEEYVKLREHLGFDPVSIDILADRSGLTIDQVSSMLLILELDGIVEKLSGGRFALLKPSD
ncbi:MAG: DNA-processing protein DprA [Woeseiaceae bacterium]|nr:DNA-processing protein DprA [Woeseiaceae bacterium]